MRIWNGSWSGAEDPRMTQCSPAPITPSFRAGGRELQP
jgi:hypothetical protein